MIITRVFEPNKKLRRACFVPGAFVIAESDLKTFEYHASGGEVYTWHPNFTDITAIDWEVVEDKPVIEVGDTVKRSDSFPEAEHIVTWIRGSAAQAQYKDDAPRNCQVSDLTLIRKGSKVHVFEGVTWYAAGDRSGLFTSIDSKDKVYRMELTEEVE